MLPATTSWVHYTTSCNTHSSAPEDGQNNCPKHVELTGIINKPLLLHLVGCLYYLYQWCTVKQISDNEIYVLIKYIKCVLWRVAKRLSYTEDARCLKVNIMSVRPSLRNATYTKFIIHMSVRKQFLLFFISLYLQVWCVKIHVTLLQYRWWQSVCNTFVNSLLPSCNKCMYSLLVKVALLPLQPHAHSILQCPHGITEGCLSYDQTVKNLNMWCQNIKVDMEIPFIQNLWLPWCTHLCVTWCQQNISDISLMGLTWQKQAFT